MQDLTAVHKLQQKSYDQYYQYYIPDGIGKGRKPKLHVADIEQVCKQANDINNAAPKRPPFFFAACRLPAEKPKEKKELNRNAEAAVYPGDPYSARRYSSQVLGCNFCYNNKRQV